MNAPKRKGTSFESDLVSAIATLLGRRCHRLSLHGGKDIGDIAIDGIDVCIEAKNAQRIELGQWMDELRTEQANAGTRWGWLIVRRRRAAVERSYVVMELDQALDLLDAAHWRPEPPMPIHKPRLSVVRHPAGGGAA